MPWAFRIAAALNIFVAVALVFALNKKGVYTYDVRISANWLRISVALLAANALAWVMASVAFPVGGRTSRLFRLWLDAKETELTKRAKAND